MAKAQLKTAPTGASVTEFLNSIDHEERRRDAKRLAKLLRETTGKRPKMWGPSIVGYGKYAYKYTSGREGEYFRAGFSPRKANLVVYIMPGYTNFSDLLKKLGPHKIGKSCLYLKRLDDIDLKVLQRLVEAGWRDMEQRYGKA